MTDYLNPHKIYSDGDKRLGPLPGSDPAEDYIVFDRTGTPHVVVATPTDEDSSAVAWKTEIGGNCQQSGNREVEG